MQLTIYVQDTDYTDAALHEQTRIRKEISGSVSTASFSFVADSLNSLAKYDEAKYDEATYGVDVRELYEILAVDETDTRQFAGYVTRVRYERQSDNLTTIKCDCNDYTILLERVVIPEATFTGQSDRAIIQSLIATYAPQLTASIANIAQLAPSIGTFVVKDKTLRAAIEELAELTGGEWRVDFHKNLHYFAGSISAADFGLSTSPNGTTTHEYRIDSYDREFTRPVNKCTVLGGLLPGGHEIKATYQDPTSIAQYGVHATTIIDREITAAADALLRAQVTVQQNAFPHESGTLVCWQDGLDIGQTVHLTHDSFALDGPYLIRSMEMAWITPTDVEYTIGFGSPQPSLERTLRMLQARARRATSVPMAVPAPGSVTDASIGSTGLSTSHLVGIVSGTNVQVDASTLIGTVSGTNVVVNTASLSGVIQGPNVQVDVGTFLGAIISDQVADNLINRLSMYADALRPIPNLTADPALPSANYPEGAYYFNTSTETFRKNVSGTWQDSTRTDAVSGKVEFYHVGKVEAGSIIGVLAAGNIGEVNVSALIGTLTAANAARINIEVVQGNLDVSRINNLNTLSISSFTGNLDASRVSNLNTIAISSFSGNLDVSRVTNLGTISINTFTGTLNASKINQLNVGSLTLVGQWGNDHLASGISATKLTVGTLNAALVNVINLNASNITTGTMSVDRLTAGSVTLPNPNTSLITVGSGTYQAGMGSRLVFTQDSSANSGGIWMDGRQFFIFTGTTGPDIFSGNIAFAIDPRLSGGLTASSAVGGSASALPAAPAGYARMYFDGALRRFPYYN